MRYCDFNNGPEFTLDLQEQRLWEGSKPIQLTPRTFSMLRLFVTHPNRLLTKQTLLEEIWNNRFVTESQVKQVVQQLRGILKDNPRSPRYIETVHRRGYRFIGVIKLEG